MHGMLRVPDIVAKAKVCFATFNLLYYETNPYYKGETDMLGLEKGRVILCEHETVWDENAKATIQQLQSLFGALAIDV